MLDGKVSICHYWILYWKRFWSILKAIVFIPIDDGLRESSSGGRKAWTSWRTFTWTLNKFHKLPVKIVYEIELCLVVWAPLKLYECSSNFCVCAWWVGERMTAGLAGVHYLIIVIILLLWITTLSGSRFLHLVLQLVIQVLRRRLNEIHSTMCGQKSTSLPRKEKILTFMYPRTVFRPPLLQSYRGVQNGRRNRLPYSPVLRLPLRSRDRLKLFVEHWLWIRECTTWRWE